jgi:hypothetical protein
MGGASGGADSASVAETHIDSCWFIIGEAEYRFNGAFSGYTASLA